jgi:carbon monoxide dehydrogenase subunit G
MTTRVEKTITVDVPVRTAYNQWTQFEEFPQFMGGVQKVEQLDDQRLHWVAEIAGVRREWNADILEQRPDEKIAWAAIEGTTNAGAVYFVSAGPAKTQVTLELEYAPEGLVEKVGDALNIIERQAQSDLERFKTFIESRGSESGAWRGEVGAPAVGTPGVELASSQGDSGNAGVSPKVAAVGAAAVVAGAAAVAAATKSGSDNESATDKAVDEDVTDVDVEVVAVETVPEPLVGASDTDDLLVPPTEEDTVVDPILGTPAPGQDRGGRGTL